ncbi:hypothetical protein PROFUN_02151 [Planoprotostelium fungivorum]|uniref:MIT domain-containing protein n=1 Tax=Planoprotostelium fungivorum TaxID=1890364 RepID=A0A2P6NZA0_9EUKA|nr:hypothetical protein PROFUN_02151 [Planoprotostelium fungivorum]
MDKVNEGLKYVNQACQLDALGMSDDALPLYKQSIDLFRHALDDDLDANLRTIMKLKISEYESRVDQIERQTKTSQKHSEQSLLDEVEGVEHDPSFADLENRLRKLKENDPPAAQSTSKKVTEDELHDRLEKLMGRPTMSRKKQDLTQIIGVDEMSEEDQIQRILQQTADDVHLDALDETPFSAPPRKSRHSRKKRTSSSEDDSDSCSSEEERRQGRKKGSQKKNERRRGHDDDYNSDEGIDKDEDFQDRPGDDAFTKRQKAAMRQMYAREAEMKRKAYEKWTKGQF